MTVPLASALIRPQLGILDPIQRRVNRMFRERENLPYVAQMQELEKSDKKEDGET